LPQQPIEQNIVASQQQLNHQQQQENIRKQLLLFNARRKQQQQQQQQQQFLKPVEHVSGLVSYPSPPIREAGLLVHKGSPEGGSHMTVNRTEAKPGVIK